MRFLTPCDNCEGDVPNLAVPVVKQSDAHSCGIAAASMLLRFHGKRLDIAATASPIDGTDPRTLEWLLRRNGLHCHAGEGSIDDLRHHLRRGRPSACLIQLDGCGHWVVVRGVSRSRVHFNCPLAGADDESIDDFVSSWIDHDGKGEVWKQWHILAFVGET